MEDLSNDWKIKVFKLIQYDLKNLKSNSDEENDCLIKKKFIILGGLSEKVVFRIFVLFCEIEDGN